MTSDLTDPAVQAAILHRISSSPYPHAVIGDIAHHHGTTAAEIKALLDELGWQPNPAPVVPQQRPAPCATDELLATAVLSQHAQARRVAVEIGALLADLRVLIDDEVREAITAPRTPEQQDQARKELAAIHEPIPPATAAAIRAWADANDIACPERGRVPRPVRIAYELAHQTPAVIA
jgi:hypothetical protein